MTPAEFHYAVKDYERLQFLPSRNVCETLRMIGVIIHNSAFGRKKKDMIRNPRKLFEFSYEREKKKGNQVMPLNEQKQQLMSIASMFGVTLSHKKKKKRRE